MCREGYVKEFNLSKPKYQIGFAGYIFVLWMTFEGLAEDQMCISIKNKSKHTGGIQEKMKQGGQKAQ